VIRVAIVEDHPLYREGLAKTIQENAECELVGTFESVGAFEACSEATDVLLLDLHLPDCEGTACVERLRDRAASILVISASADRTSVISAIAAGSQGYLTKAAEADEIGRAIRTVTEGGAYVSPQLAEFLLGDARASESKGSFALTDREREILRLVAEGDTDAHISQRLFISVSTVRSHLDRIRDKTGHRRRADLTRLSLEEDRTSST
jgi:DNA-binding NarL/FixJ family response regulator